MDHSLALLSLPSQRMLFAQRIPPPGTLQEYQASSHLIPSDLSLSRSYYLSGVLCLAHTTGILNLVVEDLQGPLDSKLCARRHPCSWLTAGFRYLGGPRHAFREWLICRRYHKQEYMNPYHRS